MHRKKPFKRLKSLIFIIIVLPLFGLALGAIVFFYVARGLPDPETIVSRKISESTKIMDRSGQIVLYNIHGEEKRTIVSWDNISENIKTATLVSEDASFFSHQGLDFKGIVRAFIKNVARFQLNQGGSTITQQLVKNALVGKKKTFTRKIKEAILSLEIERRFSKEQIFWMYLNQIPYGSNVYGIESASQVFFAKPAKDLTLAESSFLASLIRSPSYYLNHLEEALARKDILLKKISSLGYISEEELQKSLEEKLEVHTPRENIIAPHFVIMVKDYLIKKYGEETVENEGLRVYTTLDYQLQSLAEVTIDNYAEKNEKLYKAKNAALTAVDPKTGQILAMVGSRDYFDTENQGNFNVALAKRQPGSAFKPFAYAEAFKKGYTDSTIIFDLQTEFNPHCSAEAQQEKDEFGLECYHPQNYTGRFSGPVTIRQALAQSLNVPSVKVLYLAGLDDTINLAENMGITTLEENRKNFGLSLVLGGAEVKLLDITSAYGVFANDGVRQTPAFIMKVKDAEGNILEEYKPREERMLEPQIARTINNILSDNRARVPVFGPNSSLYFPDRVVAAKTGTTQENRDAWIIGYTPSLSVGVWVGNNLNESMTKEGAGISAAGPLWHEFLSKALENKPLEDWLEPDPMISGKIMLNGSYLYKKTENGVDKTEIHSILYYVDKDNPQGPVPDNPYSNPQFKNWEEAVIKNYYLPFYNP